MDLNQPSHQVLAPSAGLLARESLLGGGVAMETRYEFRAYNPDGKLLWEEEAKNRVVTVGLNQLLTNAFKSTAVNSPWYVGIVGPAISNAAMTTGLAVLGSTSAPWQAVDEGQPIVVRGAGAGGADLTTYISTVTTSSSIGLSTTAATSVVAAAVLWGARSTDTSTAHTPWVESTYYSGAPARPSFTPGTAAAGSIDNSASVASYAINNNNTLIGGAFIANSSVVLSSTDTLYGMAPFTSNGFRQLNNGDTLQVTVTLTATST